MSVEGETAGGARVRIGRNDTCPCGSGRKYKKCCAYRDDPQGLASAAAPADPVPGSAHPDFGAWSMLLQSGRFAELEQAARAWLASHPDSGVIWKFLGAALWSQGKDALPALEQAARALPEDPEAQTNLGNVLRARGRLEEAAARHERALALAPDYAEAHTNLGAVLRDLGRAEEARASYERALSIKPSLAIAHDNLGLILQSLGRFEEARNSHRRAIGIKPDFAAAHHHLGQALLALKCPEDAVMSFRRATLVAPAHLEGLLALGATLLELGRAEEAVVPLRRLVELDPSSAEGWNNLGSAERELGEFQAAAACYRRALDLKPQLAEIHNNLGNALLDIGDLEAAIESYRTAIEHRPGYARALSNLGSAYREIGQLDEAEVSYRAALELEPSQPEVLTNLGIVLRLQSRSREAQVCVHRALEIDPRSPLALTFLGDLKADLGEFEEAERRYREAVAIDPGASQAWAGIASLRKMSEGDAPWLEQTERLVAKRLRPRAEAHLRYAMGKYCDDVGDFDRAFEHYRRANELKRSYRAAHDREHLAATFDFVTRFYDRTWVQRARAAASDSDRPVFVVGMPRSGTTLTEQILAAHPAAFGAGELSFWKLASPRLVAAAVARESEEPLLAMLARDYLDLLARLSADALRVVDKMPANFANLGMIHAALPRARIIHMRRHPIDTCLSIYFQNFHNTHTYSNDLADLAHYYRQYLRVMTHWREVLPAGTMLEVPYEALVEDPETWSRKLLEFVGLPWDSACLEFHRIRRSVTTFSKWQVRQKISRTSVERWRNYEQYVGPLLPLVEAAAGY